MRPDGRDGRLTARGPTDVRVLITGATGFVGSFVLRRLLADGRHEVAALIRDSADPWRIVDVLACVSRIEADLGDLGPAEGRILDFAPEAVLHLAWTGVSALTRDDPAQVAEVARTLALVRVAARAGARHWIGLGSQAEYGPREGPTDEEAPTRPVSLYGIAKLSAGLVARHQCAAAGLRFAWLRLFSTYGPMEGPDWLLPGLIRRLLRGERPALTAGEQRYDYLYVEDAAEAICRTALAPTASGLFNLGSGRAVRLRDLIERVRDLVDPRLPLEFGAVPYRDGQVMHLQAETSRLRDAIGWSPAIGLDEGLRRTLGWFRGDRERHDS